MLVQYEGACFKVGLKSSLERSLIKQAIKRRIGKFIGKPYRLDPYLTFAQQLLAPLHAPVIVDIGANIGTTALPLAVSFPKAKFYAVEPHPLPASRLIENCAQNRVTNVHLIAAAIGTGEGMAQIHTCPTNSGGHRLTGFDGRKDLEKYAQSGSIMVPLKPLSTIFREFKIERCHLLKIDTEGYEVFVLESLGDDLRPDKVQHVVAEFGPEGLRQAGKSGWDLVSLMLRRGYNCKVLGSDQLISCESQVPTIPDFTVTDFLFSKA